MSTEPTPPVLNSTQQRVLNAMTSAWAPAPSFAKSQTLLALREKGLIECKSTIPGPLFDYGWNSFAWHWRRKT